MKDLQNQILHWPTLETVLMVEHTLQDAKEVIKIAEMKRRLPRKVMHQTLMRILDYLQESGKILITTKGVVWTYTPKNKMQLLKKDGITLEKVKTAWKEMEQGKYHKKSSEGFLKELDTW